MHAHARKNTHTHTVYNFFIIDDIIDFFLIINIRIIDKSWPIRGSYSLTKNSQQPNFAVALIYALLRKTKHLQIAFWCREKVKFLSSFK